MYRETCIRCSVMAGLPICNCLSCSGGTNRKSSIHFSGTIFWGIHPPFNMTTLYKFSTLGFANIGAHPNSTFPMIVPIYKIIIIPMACRNSTYPCNRLDIAISTFHNNNLFNFSVTNFRDSQSSASIIFNIPLVSSFIPNFYIRTGMFMKISKDSSIK